MLPTGYDPAAPDLEDDAAARIEALAVALASVVMNGHHAALVAPEHLLQIALKVPFVSPPYRPNWVKTASRPRWSPTTGLRPGVCHEDFSSKSSVSVFMSAALKRVTAPDDFRVVVCSAHNVFSLATIRVRVIVCYEAESLF